MKLPPLWCPDHLLRKPELYFLFLLINKIAALYYTPLLCAVIWTLAPGKTSGEYEVQIIYFLYLKGCIPILECMRN